MRSAFRKRTHAQASNFAVRAVLSLRFVQPGKCPGIPRWVWRQYRQFREAVEHGAAPHASAAEGVALQRIIDGIYRSSSEGREIEL